MDNAEIRQLVIITTIIFLIAPAAIIVYIYIYNQRKKRHIQEKQQLQSNFRQELLKTQLEVQEQTLTNISREIHDNITQVLSFVKLNLAMIDHSDVAVIAKINESRELVAQTINDLRNLSKSLSFEHIAERGLVKTIEIEADRITGSGLLNVVVAVSGDIVSLGSQHELVLFRIFQEALNNTLKHAQAKCLRVSLQYSEQLFTLTLQDDGNGFIPGELPSGGGSGLRNMQSRATLIGAVAVIDSRPGKGCSIKITLNPLQLQSDATYPDSFS